jgi:hypothetical protein
MGQEGPVAVALQMPKAGSLKGCTEADAPVIIAIMKKPAGYYVNVHNAAFPKGAVRPTLDPLKSWASHGPHTRGYRRR